MIPLGILAAARPRALGPTQSLTWQTSGTSNWSITDGARQAAVTAGANAWLKARADAGKSSGKHYFEVTIVASTADLAIGVAPAGTGTTTSVGGGNNAGDGGRLQYFKNGRKRGAGTYEDYGASFTAGDVIGIAFDAGSKTLTAYKNGVSQGTMYSGAAIASGAYEPHVATYGTGSVGTTLRFNPALQYLPEGYTGWVA